MKTIKGNLVLKKDTVFNESLTVEGNITGDFNLTVKGNINARDINAWDINAMDINARDINAWNINAMDINARDINARDISYYAVAFAYCTFECNSVKGSRENSKHFCLDGKVEIRGVK